LKQGTDEAAGSAVGQSQRTGFFLELSNVQKDGYSRGGLSIWLEEFFADIDY
jgi:hypothetical protein